MELLDYSWDYMEPLESDLRGSDASLLDDLYHEGFIDARRYSLNQWKQAYQRFAKGPGNFQFKRSDWDGLKNYFFAAEIKRPFEPSRLKDGTRPLEWTGELYHKVLRFETSLSLEAWKKIVEEQILKRFKKGDQLVYNAAFKALLEGILKQHASPLRRLEVWYHFERPNEEAPASAPGAKPAIPTEERTPSSPVIRDAFVAKPEESLRRGAIDKLYFHQNEGPKIAADGESLSFLDELAEMGDDEESPLK